MPNRTPASEWGRLFNFAGGGLIHLELYEVLLVSTLNPTLFESIAKLLYPYGTHTLRPTAADVPVNSVYFETDTTNLFQNQAGTWVQIATLTAAGSTGTLGGARATATANQSIPNNAGTAITFDSEVYDTGSYHSNTTNPSRFTVPANGIYSITAMVNFAGNGGLNIGWLMVNGTTTIALQDMYGSFNTSTINLSTIVNLNANDYVELIAYQNSGAAVNATKQTAYAPMFTIERLR
jgi:hypothetical protein